MSVDQLRVELPLPERMAAVDVENVAPYMSLVHPTRVVAISAMQEGQSYDRSELHNLLLNTQGSDPAYVPTKQVVSCHFNAGLTAPGMVASAQERVLAHTPVIITYRLSEKAAMVQGTAGHIMRLFETHGVEPVSKTLIASRANTTGEARQKPRLQALRAATMVLGQAPKATLATLPPIPLLGEQLASLAKLGAISFGLPSKELSQLELLKRVEGNERRTLLFNIGEVLYGIHTTAASFIDSGRAYAKDLLDDEERVKALLPTRRQYSRASHT